MKSLHRTEVIPEITRSIRASVELETAGQTDGAWSALSEPAPISNHLREILGEEQEGPGRGKR